MSYQSLRNEVCAIVVTYNRVELLLRCIDAIKKQSYKCSIVVIDNASSDGTENVLREETGVHYLRLNINEGLSAGICYGISYAVKHKYKYFWILDDDMEPDIDALSFLMDASDKVESWSCLSSFVYWKDGGICKANRQKKGIFTFVKDVEYKYKELIFVKMVSWGSMLLNADSIKKVGLPIANFFIYTDDYEFSNRLSDYKPIYVVPQSRVRHNMEKNEKTSIVNATSERIGRFKYLFRNDIYFYRQFGAKGWAYILVKSLINITMVLLKADDKSKKLKIILYGIKEGVSFYPSINYLKDES